MWGVGKEVAKSLRKLLSGREPDDHEFEEALAEIYEGSDRAAAILGAALLEFTLTSALRDTFADNAAGGKLLDDFAAPLGTFAAKIQYARASGFVGKRIADDMDVIRDIRNQFAHAPLKLSFGNEHIVRACDKLFEYHKVDDILPNREISKARARYENAAYWIIVSVMTKHRDLLATDNEKQRSSEKPSLS